VLGPRNSRRFSPYLRFDFKAGRTIQAGNASLRFEVEVINLTDRRNTCCIDDVEIETLPDGTVITGSGVSHWLGFTPTFRVIWEF